MNEEKPQDLAGAQFAAHQHLLTVKAQAAIIASQAGEITALTAANKLLAAQVAGPVEASIGDDEQFLFLLNGVIGAGLESHACGGDFGSGDKMHAAEEKLIAYIDSRAAKVSARAADAPSEPSDLAKQLRLYEAGQYDGANHYSATLLAAADALDSQPTDLPPLPERDGDWAGDDWYTADTVRAYGRQCASSQPTDGAPAQQLYRFKRINKGVVMADGIGVHASSMEEAIEKAQKLKDYGDITEFESNKPCVRKCEICQPTDGEVRNG